MNRLNPKPEHSRSSRVSSKSFPVIAHGFAVVALSAAAAWLTGCGTGIGASGITAPPLPAGGFSGVFMGGQQPVAGVTVQLYQAGTGGYGTAASKLGPSVLTSSAGNFTFPSYTCALGSQIYVAGTGGQPIAANGTNPAVTNNNLAMMTGMGTCGGTYASGFVVINELTTVATIYALAPFMSGIANVATSPANQTGLNNAFDAINQVVNVANGAVGGPVLPAGATLPVTQINTLADILEVCINSGGGSASDTTDGQTNGTPCGKLFYLTNAGTAPTDTVTAMLNLAHNPANNVAKLNQLRSASPVFQPALNVNTPPAAFTIGITYTGGGAITGPTGIATDSTGNVWVANGTSTATKLAPSGVPLFTATGLSSPTAVALDLSNNAWITNSGNNTLSMIPAGGGTPTTYSGNGLATPKALTIDGAGNVFVSNSGGVSGFSPTGVALPGSPFTTSGTAGTIGIAATPR